MRSDGGGAVEWWSGGVTERQASSAMETAGASSTGAAPSRPGCSRRDHPLHSRKQSSLEAPPACPQSLVDRTTPIDSDPANCVPNHNAAQSRPGPPWTTRSHLPRQRHTANAERPGAVSTGTLCTCQVRARPHAVCSIPRPLASDTAAVHSTELYQRRYSPETILRRHSRMVAPVATATTLSTVSAQHLGICSVGRLCTGDT